MRGVAGWLCSFQLHSPKEELLSTLDLYKVTKGILDGPQIISCIACAGPRHKVKEFYYDEAYLAAY
jgi:hypothetical protein